MLCVCNFTPVTRENYRLGVPVAGAYRVLLDTDDAAYGGSGVGNAGPLHSEPVPVVGREHSLSLTLPPLATVFLGLAEGKDADGD